MPYSLSCSEPIARVRAESSWLRCLPLYYAEADPTTAIFQDSRKLGALQQRVHQTKKKMELQLFQIKEITEAQFIEREAVAASIVVTAPSSSTNAEARSRSPRPTLARHTPFEGVKELLPKLSGSERLAVLALLTSGLYTCHVRSPQTTLLEEKARFQRELLKKPFTEWAEVMAPFIKACRADPRFKERDVTRLEQHGPNEVHACFDPFHEAIQFLYNWPPHQSSAGTFKETRCCQLDPPIQATTWYKSGPLHCYEAIDHRLVGLNGPFKVPLESHEVLFAKVQFYDCEGSLSPVIKIKMKHFMENKNWVKGFPPPDLTELASTYHKFNYVGYLCDYAAPVASQRSLFFKDEAAHVARNPLGAHLQHMHRLRDPDTPAWVKIFFDDGPEPPAADRLALFQANLKSQGLSKEEAKIEVLESRESREEKVGPTAQELLALQDDDEEEEDA